VRKLFIGALLAVAALAIASIAWGAVEQTYEQSFTSEKPGKPTGTVFDATASDPEAPGQQAPPAREVVIRFPDNTKVDNLAAPRCKADESDFNEEGEDACPRKSKIGDGNATVRAPNGQDVKADVTAFNRKNGLYLYTVPEIGQPVVLQPRLKKGVTPKLITRIPALCLPPGTYDAADDRCEVSGEESTSGEIVLAQFHLETDVVKKGRGKSQKTLIRTPKRCPSNGEWEFVGIFRYKGGSSTTLSSTTPCEA
jgi:hypothetical protein